MTCVGAKKQNNAADCVVSHPGHARLPYRALEVTRQRSHHGPSRMLSAACTSNPGAPRRTRARASPQFCHVLIAIMHHNLPHGETFLGSYVSRCLIPSTRRPSPSNKIFLRSFFLLFSRSTILSIWRIRLRISVRSGRWPTACPTSPTLSSKNTCPAGTPSCNKKRNREAVGKHRCKPPNVIKMLWPSQMQKV